MVRVATKKDIETISKMAINVFTNSKEQELKAEFENLLKDKNVCLIVKEEKNQIVGFAQVGLRVDYVEGCETSPVGYLEGIFVMPPYRNKGYAKELIKHAESWAKEKGCSEFASDCELENLESLAFHLSIGFAEQNRIICFKKNI